MSEAKNPIAEYVLYHIISVASNYIINITDEDSNGIFFFLYFFLYHNDNM